MTPVRWEDISRIYADALAHEETARPAFLLAACDGDPDLQREVESLLENGMSSTPAFAVVGRAAMTAARAGVGTRLGVYRLKELIGEGGMGEVYRAHDEALGRDVAIKILPRVFAADPDRRARFEREARVLASLNHPHIAAIYGLAEGDGLRGLVLEFVDGETLAERLSRGMRVADVVAVALQIVDALDAAHERGVVHRDLKPSNIKISAEGTVKVLDFGLAKAAAPEDVAAPSVSAAHDSSDKTQEGMILGTTAYMSPEQARGRPVDKRTDVWSFGCVLFEMLSGRMPFTGETTPDVIVAILEREPDWTGLPADMPPALARLLRRCLEKNPRRRLRDIGDALEDLSNEALAETVGHTLPAAPAIGRRAAVGWTLTAAGLCVVVVAAAWQFGRPAPASPPTFSRVVRLTSGPALEFGPAISPDGEWVAYFSTVRGPTDVWVKSSRGGSATNLTVDSGLTLPTRTDIGGLAISPDGRSIAFDAGATPGTPSNLYDSWVIPAPLGGIPRKLVERGRSVRWSPDGTRITYMRAGGLAGDSLYVAATDGTNERQIVAVRGGMHIHWPAWSADSGSVYFIYSPATGNSEPSEIYRVPAAGGPPEPVVRTARRAVFPAPTPDGGGLLYAANPRSTELGLWWKPLIGARPSEPVTNAVGEYGEIAIGPAGTKVVATVFDVRQTLIVLSVDGPAAGRREAMTDGFTGDVDPTFSPDGTRLVFASSRDGSRSLWTADTRGDGPRPLSPGTALDERPAFSPDGRRIAFVSDRAGQRGIWVMNSDGGAPRLVVEASVLDYVSWSPDGRDLVYSTPVDDAPGLRVVTVDTGLVRNLPTPGPATGPTWSPRGDLIAYVEARQAEEGRPNSSRIAFVNRAGEPRRPGLSDTPNILNGFLAWSPDGRHLAAFVEPGATSGLVWIVDITGAEPPWKLTELPAGVRVRGATWSPDGARILFGQTERTSDIVLFER
jgi:Tol biopolymer transport system component